MYPPLYPIALIFSKLLPYDFKNNFLTLENEEEILESEKTVIFSKNFQMILIIFLGGRVEKREKVHKSPRSREIPAFVNNLCQ